MGLHPPNQTFISFGQESRSEKSRIILFRDVSRLRSKKFYVQNENKANSAQLKLKLWLSLAIEMITAFPKLLPLVLLGLNLFQCIHPLALHVGDPAGALQDAEVVCH